MAPRQLDAPVSSSSFLDLKAQLSKHEDDFAKHRASGHPSTIHGGVPRGQKKLPAWARQNKGLATRQARDQVVYEEDVQAGRDPQAVRDKLEKKAAIYDKIRKGKSAGLSEAQIDALLVDFDAPTSRRSSRSPSPSSPSSSSEDEAPAPTPSVSDPLVEFTDEFGRARLIPRSEVPRGAPFRDPAGDGREQFAPLREDRAEHTGEGPDPANVYYGDQHSFPVYAPAPEVLAARAATLAAAAAAPLVDHYSASGENRTRGAGFYAFSADEGARAREMEALQRERAETERVRREKEREGDRVRGERERERAERKRAIEEKRREVEERRAKRARAAGAS
ncbi:hypothetical protein JCM10450v2_005170 [Rhodotorula kratochvilovae]